MLVRYPEVVAAMVRHCAPLDECILDTVGRELASVGYGQTQASLQEGSAISKVGKFTQAF